jgi:carbon-monoxide dehydrogenase medium subunit
VVREGAPLKSIVVKMPRFTYHRPTTTDEALQLLSQYGDEAKVLAGGQSLLPLLALRLSHPAHLIDIGRVSDLVGVEERDDRMVIGAAARHSDLEQSQLVARVAPLVGGAMPHVGHRAIRNRGTACGSLAHADPAAELPAVVLALGADLVVRRAGGERTVPAADFFLGYLTVDVADNELLTEVRLPPWSVTAGWSVSEVCRRHGDFALLGACVVLDVEGGGRISEAAISLFGAASTPVRVEDAEKLLVGESPAPEVFEAAAEAVKRGVDPPGDNHGTTEYRRHLAGVLTRRGLVEAAGRTGVAA